MNVKYDMAPSVLYDTIKSLEIGYNYSGYPRYMINQLSLKSFDMAWKSLERGMVSMALFFTINENNSLFNHIFMEDLWEIRFIDELMDYMHENVDEIAIKALKFYGKGSVTEKQLEDLKENKMGLWELIGGLPISDKIKWELSALISDPKYIFDNFFRLLQIVSKSIRRMQRENKEDLRDFRQIITTELKRDGKNYLQSNHSIFGIYDNQKSIHITCSVITDTAIEIIEKNERVYIFMGINHSEKSAGEKKSVEYDKFFKALGDKNRMDILSLLIDGEMYVGEIANKLGKGMSNISYHIDMLQTNGILKCRFEGKKAFYTINKSNLSGILALFKLDFHDAAGFIDNNNSYTNKNEGSDKLYSEIFVRQ